jgi:hypothetical protein
MTNVYGLTPLRWVLVTALVTAMGPFLAARVDRFVDRVAG